MGLIPNNELITSNAPFSDAARIIWGSWGGYIIAGVGVISCFGALNGWILLQGQMPMAASLDGLLPPKFSRLSKYNTPAFAITISSILASLLMIMNYARGFVEKFTFIILIATLATLLPYLVSSLAQIKLLIKDNNIISTRKKRFIFVISSFALLYSIWAIIGIGIEVILLGTLFIFTGVPVYLFRKRKMK
jgi:APA family basic amino acid/polyamine antiporter